LCYSFLENKIQRNKWNAKWMIKIIFTI
jgi:hypothetical protein